jgi:protein-S-isoprenylcysteine O-methyltransferase Ste14
MSKELWRVGVLFSLVLGLALLISPALAMLAAVFLVIASARVWWQRDFPGTWQYGLQFLAFLLGLGIGAAAVLKAGCKLLAYTGTSVNSCQWFGLSREFLIFAALMLFMGMPFWLWHMWVVWRIKRS